jgi:hypothetical protein
MQPIDFVPSTPTHNLDLVGKRRGVKCLVFISGVDNQLIRKLQIFAKVQAPSPDGS